MRIDDLPAAFAVRLSTLENAITLEELEEDYGITPASLAKAMGGHVRGWLCEDRGEEGEQAVGFAMGDRANGEVQVVALRPGYEGRGIGRRLLALVCDWLFAGGHAEIWLRANPDPAVRAHGFYRHLGWQATGARMGGDEVMTLSRHQAHRG
jgi:GNAT superfamily N-acetyltransferase